MQELADQIGAPLVYLVDAAGARIDEQFDSYAGRRAWGNIFFNQIAYSGRVPQVCALFGPSPAGSAYVPALCDVTIMVRGHATAYLGSPRLAEMVTGEQVSLEEMGGAEMHCRVSGVGDVLVDDDEEAIAAVRLWLSYFPPSWEQPAAGDRGLAGGGAPPDRGDRAGPRGRPVRHAGAHRRDRRRGHVLPVQGPVRPGADHRARPPRRAVRRDHRQPDDAPRRRAVLRLVRQGRPLHLDLQRLQHPAAVPHRHLRLHDRHRRRARRDHPPRRQDALRGVRVDRAAHRRPRAQGLRRRLPGDVRQPDPSRRGDRPADRQAGADGTGRRRQRHPLQPGDGDRAIPTSEPASSRRSGARSRPRSTCSSWPTRTPSKPSSPAPSCATS